VNYGPGHIQYSCSSEYSGFNIQVNVSVLLLDISRQYNELYTANLEPNIEHILQFTLPELWSRTYTMKLQVRIFRLQYSTERICAAIRDISTIQCASYCKIGPKYSAHPSVYAMWTVVSAIYKVFAAPHSQATIFNWTYLRCSWRYSDTSMRVILLILCQIQRTFFSLRYATCGAGHIQSIFSTACSDFNVHLNVSALLLDISRQFNARYTANLEPNTAHIVQITLCELWSRTYTMYLLLRTFRLQYSAVGNCAVIGDISTILCALYCKPWAKYSAYPPVYTMWTVVPDIYKVLTAPHIYVSIFSWR
jgi:hypothetical protein